MRLLVAAPRGSGGRGNGHGRLGYPCTRSHTLPLTAVFRPRPNRHQSVCSLRAAVGDQPHIRLVRPLHLTNGKQRKDEGAEGAGGGVPTSLPLPARAVLCTSQRQSRLVDDPARPSQAAFDMGAGQPHALAHVTAFLGGYVQVGTVSKCTRHVARSSMRGQARI